jgi:L-threonylcarbamoyladenylate synthase
VTDLRWRPGDPVQPLRDLIARGGILAIPTESSYGLAADPRSAAGVEAIYRIKSRERGKALPVVAGDLDQLGALGVATEDDGVQRALHLWPAPLSVLAPLYHPIAASAGMRTLAVRLPAHVELLELLRALGTALTATSANRSGEEPLLDPESVQALLASEDAAVVDGGRLVGGLPSTLAVWGAGGWQVLRGGRFPVADLPSLG